MFLKKRPLVSQAYSQAKLPWAEQTRTARAEEGLPSFGPRLYSPCLASFLFLIQRRGGFMYLYSPRMLKDLISMFRIMYT